MPTAMCFTMHPDLTVTVDAWTFQAVIFEDLLHPRKRPPDLTLDRERPEVGARVTVTVANGRAVYELTEYESLRNAWYARLKDHSGEAPVRATWDA